MYKISRIGRKEFAFWLVVFTLLQWPFAIITFGHCNSFYELLVPFMILCTILFFFFFGVVMIGLSFYDSITEIYTYLFDNCKWIDMHSHGIGMPGFSYDRIFWESCVFPLLMVFLIAIHLYFCVRRCKDAGISVWWALLPLYNPFMLLKKQSKIVPQQS